MDSFEVFLIELRLALEFRRFAALIAELEPPFKVALLKSVVMEGT